MTTWHGVIAMSSRENMHWNGSGHPRRSFFDTGAAASLNTRCLPVVIPDGERAGESEFFSCQYLPPRVEGRLVASARPLGAVAGDPTPTTLKASTPVKETSREGAAETSPPSCIDSRITKRSWDNTVDSTCRR